MNRWTYYDVDFGCYYIKKDNNSIDDEINIDNFMILVNRIGELEDKLEKILESKKCN